MSHTRNRDDLPKVSQDDNRLRPGKENNMVASKAKETKLKSTDVRKMTKKKNLRQRK